jgi:soluble P-type ATPase
VRKALEGVPARVVVVAPDAQDVAKEHYVRELSARTTVAIGNGRNDSRMLREAALGMVVVQEEAAAIASVTAADIACPSIAVALDLLLNPRRLVATLRS